MFCSFEYRKSHGQIVNSKTIAKFAADCKADEMKLEMAKALRLKKVKLKLISNLNAFLWCHLYTFGFQRHAIDKKSGAS